MRSVLSTLARYSKVASVVMAITTTLVTTLAAHLTAGSSDPFSQNLKMVGTLQYGETSGYIAYKNPPRYRALTFEGKKGDFIEVWVRAAAGGGGDAVAYVVDNGYKILGKNDDADNTTTDAHIKLTLPGNSNPDIQKYYIIFNDYYSENATFTVSLQGSGASKWPSLRGRWKDDLNGQQIEITVLPSLGRNAGQDKIVAKYATSGKTCRNLDGQGHPVPFPVDFEGEYSNGTVTGVIYWCSTRPDKGRTFTTGVAKGPINLKESEDGTTLSGRFQGANGSESITFTRLP